MSGFHVYIVMVCAVCAADRAYVWRNDITLWEDSAGKSPLSPRAHNNLGFAVEAAGDLPRADEEFLAALLLRPAYKDALNNLAVVRVKTGRYPEAIELYTEALRLSPDNPDIIYNRSLAYEVLGDPVKAREGYQRAISLSPCHRKAHARLGRLYERQGRRDEARREMLLVQRCAPEATIP